MLKYELRLLNNTDFFKSENVCLSKKDVLRCLGYGYKDIPSIISLELNKIFTKLKTYKFTLVGRFKLFKNFQILKNRIITRYGNIESIKIALFSRNKHIKYLAVGLVTLLKDFSIKNCQNLLGTYTLHGIKTAIVEDAENILIKTIEHQTGYNASLPFAPGYCDWDLVSGQKFIITTLNPSTLGVHVNSETFTMKPPYTISFLILLSSQKMDKTPCYYCNNKCHMRRV